MFQTTSYSNLLQRDITKILIAGAKGKTAPNNNTRKQISTLSLSETVEMQNSGIAAAFASLDENGKYNLDLKISENGENIFINSKGQLEVSSSQSQRFDVQHKKTVLGASKNFRLFIGLDYIHLQSNFLISGASVVGKTVKSRSTITVQNYLAFCEEGLKMKRTFGHFSSENYTDFAQS